MKKHLLIWFMLVFTLAGTAQEKMQVLHEVEYTFEGYTGKRIQGNIDNWLVRMPEDNPGLLNMFKLRESEAPSDLLAWAGEFAGKYLISGVQALRMSENPELEKTLSDVVDQLIASQAEDGYLGPFNKEEQLAGETILGGNKYGHWDLWGNYHVMYGLLLWHQSTGDKRALRAAIKAADLICDTFLDGPITMAEAGSPGQNVAVLHVLLLLYHETGNERYLNLGEAILTDYETGGEYVEKALEGIDYYEIRGGRWESLHILQGIAEYFLITGENRYKKAFLHHWYSINRTDVHNTGAFSTSERAIGHPYGEGAIETCCTVAWINMTIDALRLTGDPKIADALELSLFNAMLGSQHPSGEWWTYMTPMDGRRPPSYVSINFQSRATMPELNCCSVNGPRSLGCLGSWALMQDGKNLVVNYYGPMQASLKLSSGKKITLIQETDYPMDGTIHIRLLNADNSKIPMKLRIPEWSEIAVILVNGKTVDKVRGGRYFTLNREWQDGDELTLELEMTMRTIEGGMRLENHISVYRGPILFAMDSRFNPEISEPDPPHNWVPPWTKPMPPVDTGRVAEARLLPKSAREYGLGLYRPWLLLHLPVSENREITLCDFATAGFPGTSYRTWLKTTDSE